MEANVKTLGTKSAIADTAGLRADNPHNRFLSLSRKTIVGLVYLNLLTAGRFTKEAESEPVETPYVDFMPIRSLRRELNSTKEMINQVMLRYWLI